MTTKKLSVALALSFAALLGPTLSGCMGNPVEGIVEGAVEQAGGGDVDLNSDGGLPDGFPADIPLYDGEIVGGIGMGSVEYGGGWTVIVKVDDVQSAFTAIDDQLTAAGFEASLSGFSDGTGTGAYSNAQYSVLVSVTDDGSGQKTATYIVGGTTAAG
ncbi:MAG: hypothetical protein EPO52_02895 [Herbiconiux sp.]|uniref:hypothetical protein n=1 Tax=Herbiconiux sp. TaxID=1871186 RepID=UPI00121DE7A5|nr:hypothetical protein [Herbiconiux sp.]TAJ49895.1 MAG: hypothetical protein EPO52_02895 [Herbiconiux sp.]